MRRDEAEKLARRGLDDPTRFSVEDIDAICNHVLSGDHKRSIENAAYRQCVGIAERARLGNWPGISADTRNANGEAVDQILHDIIALIQPPAQKEDGE